LEGQLLAGLQERVLNPDVIEYTLEAFEEQFLHAARRKGDQSALLGRRVEAIEKQIRNCTDAISEGKRYPSLMERLGELEQELGTRKQSSRTPSRERPVCGCGTRGDLSRPVS
jgi:hypothetical protein